MGRSVSTHPHAVSIAFLSLDEILESDSPETSWDYFIDDIRNVLTGEAGVDSGELLNGHPFTGFQGYSEDDRWAGREDRVILTGEVSEITISEYMGVAAVCLAPLDPDNDHHVIACRNAAPYFKAILHAAFPKACLELLGRFSNGESVYQVIE